MQSFLLAAMKFHCHHTAMQRGHISDTRHVISVIEAGISFMTGAAGSGSIPKGSFFVHQLLSSPKTMWVSRFEHQRSIEESRSS
jgi:hypothetical protein